MDTVVLLQQAIALAESLGYRVRQEYLEGSTGGLCEFGGRKFLFLDASLTSGEQLETLLEALERDAHPNDLADAAATLPIRRPRQAA